MDDEIDRVLLAFSLPARVDARRIPLGTQGRKFVVKTRVGDYFLRCHAPPLPLYFAFAMEMQQRVAEELGLAPRLLRTSAGGLWLELNGVCYAMEECIHGESRHLNAQDAGVCGSALGQMHRFVAPLSHTSDAGNALFFLAGMAYGHTSGLQNGYRNEACPPDANFLLEWRHALDPLLSTIPGPGLPCGTHGDINPTNILWQGDRVFFCDFTNASRLPQIVDVGMAIIGLGILGWDFTTNREVLGDGIVPRRDVIAAFFRGYSTVRALNSQEYEMLPQILVVLWGFWSNWFRYESEEQRLRILRDSVAFARSSPDLVDELRRGL